MSLTLYTGPAFRVIDGFNNGAPRNASAADVVRVEIDRGNIDSIEPELLQQLERIPATKLLWVGRSKAALMSEYGNANESGYAGIIESIEDISDVTDTVQGGLIISEDEAGALVWNKTLGG